MFSDSVEIVKGVEYDFSTHIAKIPVESYGRQTIQVKTIKSKNNPDLSVSFLLKNRKILLLRFTHLSCISRC